MKLLVAPMPVEKSMPLPYAAAADGAVGDRGRVPKLKLAPAAVLDDLDGGGVGVGDGGVAGDRERAAEQRAGDAAELDALAVRAGRVLALLPEVLVSVTLSVPPWSMSIALPTPLMPTARR